MIVDRIKLSILPGMIIPKPQAKADFKVKGWGMRREQEALIYLIPNHRNPGLSYQKGITVAEFNDAYYELMRSGEISRRWFNSELSHCANEGGCNFTTIGGIFEILGIASYYKRGVYILKK